jgi:hypothetical protein
LACVAPKWRSAAALVRRAIALRCDIRTFVRNEKRGRNRPKTRPAQKACSLSFSMNFASGSRVVCGQRTTEAAASKDQRDDEAGEYVRRFSQITQIAIADAVTDLLLSAAINLMTGLYLRPADSPVRRTIQGLGSARIGSARRRAAAVSGRVLHGALPVGPGPPVITPRDRPDSGRCGAASIGRGRLGGVSEARVSR